MKTDTDEQITEVLSILTGGDPVKDFFDESEVHEELQKALAELRYLRFFFNTADFGPAHGDVMYVIDESFEFDFPEGYGPEDDES